MGPKEPQENEWKKEGLAASSEVKNFKQSGPIKGGKQREEQAEKVYLVKDAKTAHMSSLVPGLAASLSRSR